MQQEYKRINKNLATIFGTDDKKRPWFRISLSDQTELRKGTFEEWYHGIFLREFKGCKLMPKYEYIPWDDPRWVLEKLVFMDLPDVPTAIEGTYEPVWVFYGPNGAYQKPVWNAVNLLVYLLLFGPKTTRSDFMAKDEKNFNDEVDMMEDYINDFRPWIASQLTEGHGIAVPHNYERKNA